MSSPKWAKRIAPFVFELEAEGTADAPDFRLRAETGSETSRGHSQELRRKAVAVAREIGPTSKTKIATRLEINKRAGLKVVDECLSEGLLKRSEDGQSVLAPSEPASSVLAPSEPVGTEALPLPGNSLRNAA